MHAKERSDFPAQFASIEEATAFCRGFFDWYKHDHYHSGIALLTPATVHNGQADEVVNKRNPKRFINRQPAAQPVPEAA